MCTLQRFNFQEENTPKIMAEFYSDFIQLSELKYLEHSSNSVDVFFFFLGEEETSISKTPSLVLEGRKLIRSHEENGLREYVELMEII